MADAYNRAIGNVSFRGLLDALSPTPIVGDAISGVLGLYDTGKGLLGDYKAAQEKDPRKMIRGMAANTDNYNSGLLNLGSVLPYVTPAVAGMFIGKNSKVWDALKADEAQKMLAAGADPKEVWTKTGTFKGVDGALRQEIDDSAMGQAVPLKEWVNKRDDGKFNAPNVSAAWDYAASQLAPEAPVRAKRLFKHDELAKAYPYGFTKSLDNQSIMDVPVQISQGGSQGSWGDGTLALHESLLPQPAKSTTLHELQHAIQEREGWARGGSPDTSGSAGLTKENTMDWARRAYEEAHQTSGDPLLEQLLSDAKPWESLTEREKLGWIDQARNKAYRSLAGEAEARLTQSRMNMTMPERLQVYPYDMLDVPQDQLIVRGLLGDAPTTAMSVAPTKYEQAHEVARQNAVKMLGLPENNTAMDRAKALGFDTDLYHGRYKDYDQIKQGKTFYATPDPEYASVYTNPNASSMGGKSVEDFQNLQPNVMPVMVRSSDILDTTTKEGRKVFDNDFYMQYGNGTPLSNKGYPDWVDAEDFGDMFSDKGMRFKGVLADEGAVPLPDGGIKSRGVSTAVFDPSAVRSRFAAFDPARINEPDLLGRVNPELLPWLTGAGLLGAGGMYYSGE